MEPLPARQVELLCQVESLLEPLAAEHAAESGAS